MSTCPNHLHQLTLLHLMYKNILIKPIVKVEKKKIKEVSKDEIDIEDDISVSSEDIEHEWIILELNEINKSS